MTRPSCASSTPSQRSPPRARSAASGPWPRSTPVRPRADLGLDGVDGAALGAAAADHQVVATPGVVRAALRRK
jgi:hypothetical protein